MKFNLKPKGFVLEFRVPMRVRVLFSFLLICKPQTLPRLEVYAWILIGIEAVVHSIAI